VGYSSVMLAGSSSAVVFPCKGNTHTEIRKPEGYCGRPLGSRLGCAHRRDHHAHSMGIAYAFAVCLVSLLAGSAMAADGSGIFNAFLQGKYQVNGNLSCATGGCF
jgi:hypothetical protein